MDKIIIATEIFSGDKIDCLINFLETKTTHYNFVEIVFEDENYSKDIYILNFIKDDNGDISLIIWKDIKKIRYFTIYNKTFYNSINDLEDKKKRQNLVQALYSTFLLCLKDPKQ